MLRTGVIPSEPSYITLIMAALTSIKAIYGYNLVDEERFRLFNDRFLRGGKYISL